jgi:PncC family amidohydrolase
VSTDSLAKQAGDLLRRQDLRLAVAESCTGGLLGSHITSIPGSSAYFLGGVIAYSAELKHRLLHVPQRILREEGTISSATAAAMAVGARGLFHADVALGITGLAGPAGGTPEMPVGLVHLAVTSASTTLCRRYQWSGNRQTNREWSCQAALALLCHHLSESGSETGRGPVSRDRFAPPKVLPLDELDSTVRVEARFDGPLPQPLGFEWQGRWLSVSEIGRTWSVGDGPSLAQHFVVSTAPRALFELTYEESHGSWRVVRSRGYPVLV